MNSLAAALLAPLALLLPSLAVSGSSEDAAVREAPEGKLPPMGLQSLSPQAMDPLEKARRVLQQNQVRIEQRVIIRIAPSSDEARERLMANLPRRAMRQSVQEVNAGDCVAIDDIAGVQPSQGNRLLLFMRDRRIMTAALNRACSPRDFYSGFYVERHEDGRLCVGRDYLQSRAGASCQMEGLGRLVAVRD